MTITTRLVSWFLAISLIPSVALTAILQYVSANSLAELEQEKLTVLSKAKVTALEAFVRERKGDVKVAGNMPGVVTALKSLSEVLKTGPLDSPAYLAAKGPLVRPFLILMESSGFSNAFLFDMEGNVVLRVNADLDTGTNLLNGPLKETPLAKAVAAARTSNDPLLAESDRYPGKDGGLSFVAHAVIDADDKPIGVVALQIGDRYVNEILQDYSGLGETGEIVTTRVSNGMIYVVTPLRFDPEAAFRRTIEPGGVLGTASQRASKGVSGLGDTTDYRGQSVVAAWAPVPGLGWGLVVKQDWSEAYELINQQRVVVAAMLAATLVGVVLTALFVARQLTRPVRAAVEAANRVASGDLTGDLDIKAKGEVGQLVHSIQTMTRDLRTLIGKIQKSSVALMSTSTEIAATARQQEQTVHEHGASTNEAAAAARQISATSLELLRTMTEINGLAAGTASLATDGREGLSGMDRTMRRLADSTGSIGSKLSVISERAANINLFVTTIGKVADQTNLLSINAAIEAEKAGEYGLGFLVVAREIRHLADQTALSSLDIERMVKEMQYSVSAGVMEMDKFSEQVRQGVKDVAEISGKLGQIIAAVEGLTTRFDDVTEGMRVQSQGADQIREAVLKISEGASQTLDSLREFNQATGQLREAVGGLKDEVSRFQVESVRR